MRSAYPVICTDAFVLHTKKLGENDRHITLITHSHGIVRVFARSIRKEKAKMRTVVLPYRYITVSFVVGKQNILKDVKSKNSFTTLWKNPLRYSRHVSLLHTSYKALLTTEHINPAIYIILTQAVQMLEVCDSNLLEAVELVAHTKILFYLGYVEASAVPSELFERNVRVVASSEKNKIHLKHCIQKALLHY